MVDIDTIITGIITGVVTGVSVFLVQRYVSKRRISDREIFFLWNRAFDRPAFRGHFTWDCDLNDYIFTIDDLIHVINTGKIEGEEDPNSGYGKAYLKNADRRAKMDNIVDRLTRIKTTIRGAEKRISNLYATHGADDEDRRDAEINRIQKEGSEVDNTERREIIKELNEIWAKLGLPTLPMPV